MTDSGKENISRYKNNLLNTAEEKLAATYLVPSDGFGFFRWQNDVLAIASSIFDAVLQLQQNRYIKKAGINMGSIIRDEVIPSHELVMSSAFSNKFPSLPLDEPTQHWTICEERIFSRIRI